MNADIPDLTAPSSGDVPPFSGDCRKAFAIVIGEAEKTGVGTLRVKHWRSSNGPARHSPN